LAMITGSTIAVGGIIIQQLIPNFPVNGQMFWGLAMLGSTIVYLLVSLFGGRLEFDMDRMLHRGQYAVEKDSSSSGQQPLKGWKVLGMTKEFTKGDKFIYIATYVWTFLWVVVFIIGTILNLTHEVSNDSWMQFWEVYIWIYLAVSILVIIWFTIGGIANIREMISALKTMKRDHADSGYVNKTDTH
jgi:SSS family solute:Na+ symporter